MPDWASWVTSVVNAPAAPETVVGLAVVVAGVVVAAVVAEVVDAAVWVVGVLGRAAAV